jgi:hypothetical protein
MLWIRPLMPRPSEKLLLFCALLALGGACKPKIGDDCRISTDCSAAADRLCDITAPGGYCTMFNCEPGTCPDGESLCVEFGANRAAAAQCRSQQSPSPYARTFCMATCESTSDCRGGYTCADLSRPGNDWDAVLIDKGRGNKACVVPFDPGSADATSTGDVCVSKPARAEPSGSAGAPAEIGAGGQGGG